MFSSQRLSIEYIAVYIEDLTLLLSPYLVSTYISYSCVSLP